MSWPSDNDRSAKDGYHRTWAPTEEELAQQVATHRALHQLRKRFPETPYAELLTYLAPVSRLDGAE